MSIRRALPILAAVGLVALLAAGAYACPNCKEAVANSDGQGANAGATAASGFNNSILLMLGVLFTMIGAFGFRVVRAVRRAESSEA